MNRSHRNAGKQHIDQEPPPPLLELGQLRRFNELLLRFLPIGVLVIDRTYRILTANGAARRLLGLRDISIEQDFLHAVRGIPYHETRNAIDIVFREKNSVNLPEVELDVSAGGNGRYVSLSIALMQLDAGSPDLAAISIADVTQQVQVRRQLETIQAEQAQLMNELSTANKRLSDVNKELMDANEELQVANEELILTHEELQASIEEFETTNEELQATNEELETNNEELQATNEELETTNDELRARTGELQELTVILESERGRLAEMVELAPFYIMVLRGPTLIVDAYNPRYARFIDSRGLQGRPLDEVIDLFWEHGIEIVHLARDAYRMDKVFTTPRMLTALSKTQDPHGEHIEAYFTYTIVPSHDPTGKVDGVIIYAVDETEKRQREAMEDHERLQLIFNNFSLAVLALYDAETSELLMGSPRYLELVAQTHQLPQESLIGCKWQEVASLVAGERASQLWSEVLEARTPIRIPELSFPPAPDEPASVWDYSLTPIMDKEQPNTIRYIMVSAIEITEQVQARKEIEQLDTLKDDLLSLVTHELRNPLAVIQGNTQLLQNNIQRQLASLQQSEIKELRLDQEMAFLNRIVHQVQQMNTLLEEMMDVTRIREGMLESHKQEHVDLAGLVCQVVDQYGAQGHEIVVYPDEEEIRGTFDVARIEQVLDNLISNAIKYGPKDRPIVVTVGRSAESSNEAVVSVHDDGPGIPEEDQKHIFERFYRASNTRNEKTTGLGLGLYIAREIVVQQGGRMWLESEPGQGTTFYFSLPLAGRGE